MSILLTSPHSLCTGNEIGHMCDSAAHEMITQLSQKIKEATIIQSDIHRSQCDNNRRKMYPGCETSLFFQKVEHFIDTKKPILILDIHSYPNNTLSFTDSIGKIYDFVVLLPSVLYDKKLIKLLAGKLEEKRIYVGFLQGSHINWVMEYSTQKGIHSLLFEFNEDFERNNEIIDCIVECVLEWTTKNREF